MPANATKTTKNGTKPQAKKTPRKTAPVPLTPLLDAAKLNNPHKAEGAGGWDKAAAMALAVECGAFLARNPQMPLVEAVRTINEYKNFCGWGNAIQATSISLGVSAPTRKLAISPVAAQ